MCKLICILTIGSNADVFYSSSDPAVLLCSAVLGLLSFIVLIAWLRWQGDHSSASEVPTAELLGLLSHTQAVKDRPLTAAAPWGIVDAPVGRRRIRSAPRQRLQRPQRELSGSALLTPRARRSVGPATIPKLR
jgi:hypothetical protein